MRTLVIILAVVTVVLTASPAFAEYGYQYNKRGTGYWRDNSNDGNPYNNANYIGLNNNRGTWGGFGPAQTQPQLAGLGNAYNQLSARQSSQNWNDNQQ